MRLHFQLLVFLLVCSLQVGAQAWKYSPDPQGIEVYNEYSKSTGFMVMAPEVVAEGDTLGLVVFIHGFGGLNPLNYGAWLRLIIEAGNVVIYPRYQRSIFLSRPKKFADNAAIGIRGGLNLIAAQKLPVDTSRMTYVAHSYGGVLSAYMMAKEEELGFPKTYGALLAAPGTSRLKGSRLEDYSGISPDVQLVVVTHDGDHTVGSEFAELLHTTATQTHRRVWITQAEQTIDSFSINQGHNECYGVDMSFDSGYRNFTTHRALNIGCIDAVDRNLYWPMSLELIAAAKSRDTLAIFQEQLSVFEFGLFPNGASLEGLPVTYGEGRVEQEDLKK